MCKIGVSATLLVLAYSTKTTQCQTYLNYGIGTSVKHCVQ